MAAVSLPLARRHKRPCTGLDTGCLWSWAAQGMLGAHTQSPAWDLLVIWGQLHRLAGELRIKVVQAIVVRDLGLKGRQGLLLFQLRIMTRECQMSVEHALCSHQLFVPTKHKVKGEAQLFNMPGI